MIVRPEVSIIVPAYNAELFIRIALDSVIDQSFDNWELIVVNDGSTDNTGNIIDLYCEKDRRIKKINFLNNRGVSAARNSALKLATGNYIAFLDADDCWVLDKLEQQVQYAKSNNYKVTFTGIDVIDRNDQIIENWQAVQQKYSDTVITESLLIIKRNIVVGGGSTILMHKSVIEEVGYFDETMNSAEDWDYWYRISRKHCLRLVPHKLAYIRFHEFNSQNNRENVILGKLKFAQNNINNVSSANLPALQAIEAKALYYLAGYHFRSSFWKTPSVIFTLFRKYPALAMEEIIETIRRRLHRSDEDK